MKVHLGIATALIFAGVTLASPGAETGIDPVRRVIVERTAAAGGLQTVALYGSGVGIWEGREQFRVGPDVVAQVRQALDSARYQEMPDVLGSGRKWMVRRISLTTAHQSKQVVQLRGGEQSAELKALADRIFTILEPLVKDGVTASSLTDGLNKVASGALAPEALEVTLHFKPRAATQAQPGFLLQLEGAAGRSEPYVGAGYGDAVPLALGADGLRALASDLAAADLEKMPVNIYAPEYTELTVRVLNHRKSVLARRFAGLKPDSAGDAQRRFERVFNSLKAVAAPTPAHS
jgi:hypothetical protein